MPEKFKIVAGALAVALIWDTKVHYRNRAKFREVEAEIINLRHEKNRHIKQIKYLCTLIDKYDLPYDEFDLMMLNDPM